jgi:hypothetical protein
MLMLLTQIYVKSAWFTASITISGSNGSLTIGSMPSFDLIAQQGYANVISAARTFLQAV